MAALRNFIIFATVMNKELAIIIPAYKGRFLEAALDSLSRQSCMAFSVYVGDDCSPEDIGEIVSKYADSIDIVYRRFEDNLGGTDLAAHWERCIAMSSEEPYLHLFSDDDMLPYDAVERFVKTRERCPESGFFRMQLAVVDESGSVLRCNPPLAEGRSDAVDMLCDKLSGKTSSATCEYIFSRAIYGQCGGFVHFPHAWCSDDATWFRMARLAGGVTPVPGLPVLWRNVTGNNISNSRQYDRDKETATAGFIMHLWDNYPELRNRRFAEVLYNYVKCILTISLDGKCSRQGLDEICSALGRFSSLKAARIKIKYHL